MSYVLAIPAAPAASLGAAAIDAVNQFDFPDDERVAVAIARQLGAGAAALVALANVVGVDSDELEATVVGHANPDEVDQDFITLTVRVRPAA